MSQSSHHNTIRQRAIALAAMTQAVYLVDGIARKGISDADDCQTMISSLFADLSRPDMDALQLYGGTAKLQTGLRICSSLLSGNELPQNKALMTYSAGLLTLERKVAKDEALRQTLGSGMQRITGQRQYFGDAMHPNIIAAIADLYGDTISTLKPRILVRGKTEYLSQQANTRRVRALLMSGLRAAHIWHQHGGGHLNLMFRRKALVREMDRMIQDRED